jgi:signal transduction histidine kinase
VTSDEQLLASVLDFLPLGVWIARAPGGELVLANRVFREIMGMEARSDVARGGYSEPYGIFTRDGTPYPETRLPFVRALEARETVTVDDIVIHRGDGGRVDIRALARPIFDGDVITHVVIAFEDITVERRVEEQRRAGERLESIGQLAAGVAHDFNNALASVRVLATLLRVRESDAARVADLRRIEDATDRAAALSRSLLTFGRHGGGSRTRVSVETIAGPVLDLVRRTFDPMVEIRYQGRADGAWIEADPAQIEQLLMNLLVNARDALPEGGCVDVRLGGDAAAVTIEVSDDGPGIPAELRSRIFEPYFTTKQRGELPGTGLGLSTVYGIVKQHGGTIDVTEAEPPNSVRSSGAPRPPGGPGARFVVRLPAVAGVEPAADREQPVRRGSGRVLIVEDDEQVRRSTRHVLELLGYHVIEAVDGIEAVELFRRAPESIDAVLLDVVMPRQGGRVTLPALRAIRDVPVVVTSGITTLDDADAWRDLGAAALLPKPYDLGALSNALADAIRA